MTQTTDTYTEEQFIADIRDAFASTGDARGQAQRIADLMRRMFATGWPENSDKMGDGDGTFPIHADTDLGHPDPGFMVFAYRQGPRPEAPPSPHDHGACFVVYGVAKGSNVQTRFAWQYDEDSTLPPTLRETQRIVQRPGDAAYFLPGEIHATQGSTDEATVYVRVTSTDLDKAWRHRYHLEHNTSQAFQSSSAPSA